MPVFTVLPVDPSLSSTEFIAPDAAGVLNAVYRLECKDADVWVDGAYAYSLRLDDNGLWYFFHRDHDDGVRKIEAFG